MKKLTIVLLVLSCSLAAQVRPMLKLTDIHAAGQSCINALAYSPDGRLLATTGDDGTVQVHDISDLSNPKTIRFIKAHDSPVQDLDFSPDGTKIASGSKDKTVKIWESSPNGKLLATYTSTRGINAVEFSPDGKHVAAGGINNTLEIYDLASGNMVKSVSLPMTINEICYSKNGQRVAAGSSLGDIAIWNTGSWSQALTLKLTSNITGLEFTPDGARLLATTEAGDIKMLDAFTGKELFTLTVDDRTYVYSAALSIDGKTIAAGTLSGKVHTWNADDGEYKTAYVAGQPCFVRAVAFNPDGNTMAAGCFDNGIAVWGVADRSKPSATIEECVRSKMEAWLVKGEFEKTVDYNTRTSPGNKDKKEKECNAECSRDFASAYFASLSWNFTLGKYDADSEVFPITSDVGSFNLHVPIAEAQKLKESWSSYGRDDVADIKYNTATVSDKYVVIIDSFYFKNPATGVKYLCDK